MIRPIIKLTCSLSAQITSPLKVTESEALAWTTDLEQGNPQKDLSVTFYDEDFKVLESATTDQDVSPILMIFPENLLMLV